MEGTLDSFTSSYLVAKGNLISKVHVHFASNTKKWDKILSLNKKQDPKSGKCFILCLWLVLFRFLNWNESTLEIKAPLLDNSKRQVSEYLNVSAANKIQLTTFHLHSFAIMSNFINFLCFLCSFKVLGKY